MPKITRRTLIRNGGIAATATSAGLQNVAAREDGAEKRLSRIRIQVEARCI